MSEYDDDDLTEEQLLKLRGQIDERLEKMDPKKAQKKFAEKVNNMPDAEFNRRMFRKGGWDDFGTEHKSND